MHTTAIKFFNEHCNVGVLLLAVRNEELNLENLLVRMEFEHVHLEQCLGLKIPTFEDQLEKFRTELGFRTIEELTENIKDDNYENGQFDANGYADLAPYLLLVETIYLLNFAYAFFNQKNNFNSQSEISIEQYIINCADHVTDDILRGTRAMDYHFTDSDYAQNISVMTALSPMMTNSKALTDYDAMHHAMQMNGFDGVRWLAYFNGEMVNNLLTLNEDFADAAMNYLY